VTEGGIRRRLVRDTAWYGVSAALAKALALLTVPILTRTLGPEGYGLVDLATSTAALLTLVSLLSADIPATRLHALAADPDARLRTVSSYVWVVAIVSVLVAAVLLPASSLLASYAWGDADATTLALLALLLVPVSAVQMALAQTQRILSRPRTFAALSLIDLGAQLGLAVLLVLLGFGPSGVVLGFIGGSVIGLAAAAIASASVLRVAPDRAAARSIAAGGLRFLPFVTAFVLAEWIVRATLANVIGVAAVASFGVALRLASLLTLVGAAFSMAWGPLGLARERSPQTSQLFARALAGYGAASVATALVLAAMGPELTSLVAGDGYEGAAVILPGLALAAALSGTEYVLVVAAGIADRGGRVALASTAGAIVQIAATIIAVPMVGIAAVGPAAVLGRLVSFGILLLSVRGDVAYRTPLLGVAGMAAIGLALLLQLRVAAGADPGWVRWLVALALAGVAVALAARDFAPRRAAH